MSTIICIDAGHGGDFNGETHVFSGIPIYEKKINLEIALLIEEELRKYEGVEIYQTRREDKEVGLKARTQYAIDHHANYLISIHVNSLSKMKGSMILVPCTHYQPKKSRVSDIYEETNKIGLSIAEKLKELNYPLAKESENGLIRRDCSENNGANNYLFYDNGSPSDKFPTMRQGINAGIPTIIIKHAYMSSEDDYKRYLYEWKDLTNLAKADAEGIAEALHLKKKPPLNAN